MSQYLRTGSDLKVHAARKQIGLPIPHSQRIGLRALLTDSRFAADADSVRTACTLAADSNAGRQIPFVCLTV